MATKVDAAAAKQRQQKIILVVGGVILAGLVVFQGPKLLITRARRPACRAGVDDDPDDDRAATSTGARRRPAGPPCPPSRLARRAVRPPRSQAWSSGPPAAPRHARVSSGRCPASRPKDPFVQQVSDATGSPPPAQRPARVPSPGGSAATPGGIVATPSTSTPVALGYATLMVNGKPQQLALKDVFPKGQPTFVLIGVGKKFDQDRRRRRQVHRRRCGQARVRQGRHADEYDHGPALRDEARLHGRPAGADRGLQAACCPATDSDRSGAHPDDDSVDALRFGLK